NIDQGGIDSWSTRVTVQPGENWSGQYSFGRIRSPEALAPSEDQDRMTASIMYNRPIGNPDSMNRPRGNWASTVLWGRTKASDGAIENSYLLESVVQLAKNSLWTRVENAGRTNELLLGERALPPGFSEEPLTHVQAYTFGYDRELAANVPHVSVALGGQITAYGVGKPLQAVYGEHPVGGVVFLRMRLQ
ncbi:MAG TPA: hypothetical protein VJU82_05155, partial [Acidobacteriaceae bacterium]|nr:hypothetical protein [Acidobacteriaceae bacterium]